MSLYVEEFLWRGRPEGSDLPSGWHLIVGAKSVDGFGVERIDLSQALTPEQAEAMGFPLENIIAGINADALKQVDALAAQVASLQAQLDAMQAAQAGGA
ncbi:hypothetical protein [Asticcacaulis taihuensis]|uniref:hypothetical protein n=1 Tax=Asticcacaulis taihuensis TaxID=260084 RepID=UPI0026F01E16|nr:hypothetical protein [Asticcacaulis taihuensis]